MDVLKTLMGTDIPVTARGIVYLCTLDRLKHTLTINNEIICDSAFEALEYYANIPNPESQLITGKSFNDLISNHYTFSKQIKNNKWVEMLEESI